MKKTIVLLTIVLAFVAAPVFAEVSLGGEIDFGFSSDFADPDDVGTDGKDGFAVYYDEISLDVTATVDEFTTATFDMYLTDGDGALTFYERGAEFKVKTDVTGAFGIDGAADVTLITGYHDDFSNQSFQVVSRYESEDVVDSDMDANFVIGADAVVNDMFTVTFGLNPGIATGADDMNYDGDPMAMFIGAYTTVDALSVEAWYNMGVEDTADYHNSVGLSAAYAMPMDGMDFTFGAAFEMLSYDTASDSDMDYAVSAKMVMGALDASVAINGSNESNDELESTLGLSVDAGYMVNDAVTVYGGVKFEDLMADDMYFTDAGKNDTPAETPNAGAELGAIIMAGAAKWTVGYQIGAGKIYNLVNSEGMFARCTVTY